MEKIIINGRDFCDSFDGCTDNCPLFGRNPYGCPIVLPGGSAYDVEIALIPKEEDTMQMQIWRGQQ